MRDVTFIIPNRGGKHINYVIKNFKNTFNSYFDKIEFIVVNQEDNEIFKKGQLYNAAIGYVHTEYIGLLDNDIVNLDEFDPIKVYNEIGKAYVAFDKIAQIELVSRGEYKVLFTEPRICGFGAFVFTKTEELKNCNGFSNLCFGWGAEDNIIGLRLNVGRYKHVMGHIQHPRRNNLNIENREFNNSIYLLYKQGRELDAYKDGWTQTTFDVAYNKKRGDVRTLGIRNIGISDDYAYIDKYNKAMSLAKKGESGVTVCISAYKSKDTIKETLDSVYTQTYFRNHPFEVIVGIDGCEETLKYMKRIMNCYPNLRVLMMDSNKGTYVTCNTIMSEAKYDTLIRFDSDDIMLSDYVERGIDVLNKGVAFVRMGFQNTNETKGRGASYGSIIVRKDVIMRYGGYLPWICAADYELATRIGAVERFALITNVCFLRRVREDSLQYSKNTGMNSPIRAKYHEYVKNESAHHPFVKMVTNTFTQVTSDASADEVLDCVEFDIKKTPIETKETAFSVGGGTATIKCYIADNKIMSKARTICRAFGTDFHPEIIDAPFRSYAKYYKTVLTRHSQADFVLLIKSNVCFDRMDGTVFNAMLKYIKNLTSNRELGIWSSSIYTSNIPLESSYKGTNRMRESSLVSDQFVLIRSSILDGVNPNFFGCNTGAGFIDYLCKKSNALGFKNYVDDKYPVFLYTNVENDRSTIYRDEKNRFLRNNPL